MVIASICPKIGSIRDLVYNNDNYQNDKLPDKFFSAVQGSDDVAITELLGFEETCDFRS